MKHLFLAALGAAFLGGPAGNSLLAAEDTAKAKADSPKDKPGGAKARQQPLVVSGFLRRVKSKKIELSKAQRAQVDKLSAEYGPKLNAAMAGQRLTPEQIRARIEASREAKQKGLKGAAYLKAISAAVELTDAQQAARQSMTRLILDLNKQLVSILSEEQRKAFYRRPGEKSPKSSD